ncbi:MAG: ABC transporter permease [Solirubrobacteraceae bacterium]
MRWLLLKDLRLIRRSPALIATLLVYPVVIALLIGLAVSGSSARPVVAVYNGVPVSRKTVSIGSQRLDLAKYERELFTAIQPLRARSPAQAVVDVRSGQALAALIIPADIDQQIQQLISTGVGRPAIRVVYNTRNPVQLALAKDALQSRVDDVQTVIAAQVSNVVLSDLHKLLDGGSLSVLDHSIKLLGLSRSRVLLAQAIAGLPRNSPQAVRLRKVLLFSTIAMDGLALASPDIRTVIAPLTVETSGVSGSSTPASAYAASVASAVLAMFAAVLVGAGMLALERSENAYHRLVPALLSARALLSEKAAVATLSAFALTLPAALVTSVFAPLELSRILLWIVALVVSGAAFAAVGVAVGALARDVSVASLLAFLVSLPVALIALVPTSLVSAGVASLLDVISFLFPFRAALQTISNGFTATSPAMPLPLLHLAVLACVWAIAAHGALKRS